MIYTIIATVQDPLPLAVAKLAGTGIGSVVVVGPIVQIVMQQEGVNMSKCLLKVKEYLKGRGLTVSGFDVEES